MRTVIVRPPGSASLPCASAGTSLRLGRSSEATALFTQSDRFTANFSKFGFPPNELALSRLSSIGRKLTTQFPEPPMAASRGASATKLIGRVAGVPHAPSRAAAHAAWTDRAKRISAALFGDQRPLDSVAGAAGAGAPGAVAAASAARAR